MAQTTRQKAHGGIGEVHQFVGDFGPHDDVAGGDKERDGQQRQAVDAAEHFNNGQIQRVAACHNEDDTGDQQGHKDGEPQKNEGQQYQKNQ